MQYVQAYDDFSKMKTLLYVAVFVWYALSICLLMNLCHPQLFYCIKLDNHTQSLAKQCGQTAILMT